MSGDAARLTEARQRDGWEALLQAMPGGRVYSYADARALMDARPPSPALVRRFRREDRRRRILRTVIWLLSEALTGAAVVGVALA